MVAVKIAKLRPKVPTMKTATMIATMSGRCATYRNPSSNCPGSRGARAATRSCPRRSSASDSSVAAKVRALIRNTQPAPTATVSTPAAAGPTRRAALNDAELRATALGRSFSETSSDTNA